MPSYSAFCKLTLIFLGLSLFMGATAYGEPVTKRSNYTKIQSDAAPDKVRTDTPSGLSVPRFVSLKSTNTNCRVGPSLKHPRRLTFSRKGLPVKIIAETTDHWRKIQDSDGDHCWVHSTLLSGNHTAVIRGDNTILHSNPDQESTIVARLAPGVIGKIIKCRQNWCQMKVQKAKGWVRKQTIWGYKG